MVTGFSIKNSLHEVGNLSTELQDKYISVIEEINKIGKILPKDIYLIEKFIKQYNDKIKPTVHDN
jgi:hypothetical protein